MKLLVSLFLIIIAIKSVAQINYSSYSITKLTQDDGLSQGSNYFRYEDSQGFVWITGNDAINRYDGKTVKIYNLDRYFKNCPNLQQGYGITEDDNSNLYVGSTRGLYIYYRNKDKFTIKEIFTDSANKEAMPFGFINGKVWCFNKKYEIATFNIQTNTVEKITSFPISPLKSIHIYDLGTNNLYHRWPFIDRDKNIWVVSQREIFKIDSKSFETSIVNNPLFLTKNTTIYSCFYDSLTHKILLGTNNGLIIHNINEAKQKNISSINSLPLSYMTSVSCNDNLIAACSKQGIVIINKKLDTAFLINTEHKQDFRYYGLGFDKSNRLWVCNDGFGQNIYDFSSPILPQMPGGNALFAELKGMGVSTFAEFKNGDVAIQYKYLIDKEKKKLNVVKYPKNYTGNSYFQTITDKVRGGIWLLSSLYTSNAIEVFYKETDTEPILKFSIKEENNLGQLQELKILEDGRLLASFTTGLYWLNNGDIKKVNSQPHSNPFTINLISKNRCAISYLNNDMWLGLYNNTNDIKFLHKILPGKQSFYLQEDSLNKQYWVGTNNGVILLNNDFSPKKEFNANNGLAGTYIYGLLLDDAGNAWCSHQRGISSINAKTFQIINYGKKDGIQDWDFNNRAFLKASDGTLYFGGVSGFNYFKPPLKLSNSFKPEVYIDEITVNNKIWLPDTNATYIEKLDLLYNENNVALHVILKNVYKNGDEKLIYRIVETDNEWKQINANNILTFNSLSSGFYTVQLGYYDKFLNKEIIQKTLQISISIPFYKNKWLWVLAAIIGTSLTFWFINRRKFNKQKRLFEQQQALVQQRQKITADLHDDIGASLSSLQVNSAVASSLINKDVNEAKKVLEKIETQSKNIAENIGDFIWSMKPGKDEFISLSGRIKNFANDILGSSNIEYEIQIDKEVDTLITDVTMRKNILFIAKEAINNAVKYSQATNIVIQMAKKDSQTILFSARDNGVGFVVITNGGNGIANMRRRVEELNGVFTLLSNSNGTEVKFEIPIV